jgi:hypothetical protein
VSAKIIQLRAPAPPRPPLWVSVAGVIVGPLLAIAILVAWLLAALLQYIADCWDEVQA